MTAGCRTVSDIRIKDQHHKIIIIIIIISSSSSSSTVEL